MLAVRCTLCTSWHRNRKDRTAPTINIHDRKGKIDEKITELENRTRESKRKDIKTKSISSRKTKILKTREHPDSRRLQACKRREGCRKRIILTK